MKMVLHLANDYAGSTVYKNLIASLDKEGITQLIYTSVRSTNQINKNFINLQTRGSKIVYSNILSLYTRINFYHKANKIYKDVKSKIFSSEIDVIHAHTWFSDGAIAYKLFKDYAIPYIITIRSTDINIFFKKLFYLRKLGMNILLHANKIIFISESYKTKFFSLDYFKSVSQKLASKTQVIPNGIDEFWIQNWAARKESLSEPVQIAYMGSFIRRKNLIKLILAVEGMNSDGYNLQLNVIGGGGDNGEIIKKFNDRNWIKFYGKVHDKLILKDIFGKNDFFAMPSTGETFGLVYIEALSQGLPILYSRGEGVDGLYKNVGFKVNPEDNNDIISGIKFICKNYSTFNFSPEKIALQHYWPDISKKYISVYQNVL